ncbi:MAG: hypothetical protein ACJASL_005205 [Paraglaciecola sp.]|jgi:hypothetical protein
MQPLGYTFLMQRLDIELPSLGLELYQGKGARDVLKDYGHSKAKYLAANKTSEITIPNQLEMAIKHQGIRLPYIAMVFDKADPQELAQYIANKKTAVIRRAIWFLYEWYTGKKLDISDLVKVKYAHLLDSDFYFTKVSGNKCARTKIINNMLGNRQCCPTIRLTPEVKGLDFNQAVQQAEKKLKELNKLVNTDQIGRSLNYLYLKETKSSTEIEREDSRQNKTQRFFQILKSAGSIPLSKQRLLTIQNQIVPTKSKDSDYRNEDIWVGENVNALGGKFENFHYIAPKKEHIPDMMQGLIDMHQSLSHEPDIPSMVHATAVSFMFVYFHPFSDGNGRTHRYLIHDILKSRSQENNFIVPISAAILNNMSDYDRVLETISKPVMAILQYEYLDDEKTIRIDNDIRHMYQFPDLTDHLIFLHKMMNTAFNDELVNEIFYVITFDQLKRTINDLFDVGEKQLSLLVNILLENGGKFSIRKRKYAEKFFSLSEIESMEEVASHAVGIMEKFKQNLLT